MQRYLIVPILALIMLLPTMAPAGEAEDKGLEIAREADLRDTGYGDFVADMEMILKNRHGDESRRKIRTKNFEVAGDGDKILSIFQSPRDVKGTAFLSFTHKAGPDDQWLYLPALKRVKRISSSNKSGSFMGSELAYEDISSQEVEKYTYRWIKDEACGSGQCFVVEYDPVDSNSGYTRQQVWLDKETYRIEKVDYFDRKNSPLKSLLHSGYKKYLDKYWRSARMEVVNHQTGKSTTLIWTNYKFRTGLKDSDFNKNALKRAR